MTKCSKIEDFWHKRSNISIFPDLGILDHKDQRSAVYNLPICKYLAVIKEFFDLRYLYIHHITLSLISSKRARSSVRQSTWLLTRWPGVRFPSSPPFLLSTNFLGGRDHFEI